MEKYCSSCGAPLAASSSCKNCGRDYSGNKGSNSGISIAAFVTSLFVPLVGLVLGYVAKKQNPSDALAKAAIVIGWIFTILGFVSLVLLIFFYAQNELNCIRGNQYCF